MEEELQKLREKFEALESLVKAQAEIIEKQRILLEQNSKNSHWPPSMDKPKARAERRKRKSTGKKPGAQKGHKGLKREMVSPQDVSQFVDCVPQHCNKCESKLGGKDENPTNNLAERTLRHAVIMRKTSYGSRSRTSMDFIQRGLSVRQTLLSQQRRFFDFLIALLSGHSPHILPA